MAEQGDTDDGLTFSLPSGKRLVDVTVFYDKATLNKDGSATVVLKLPVEMRHHLLALSDNDGMALNIRVWQTKLPDGMEALARAIGLTDD